MTWTTQQTTTTERSYSGMPKLSQFRRTRKCLFSLYQRLRICLHGLTPKRHAKSIGSAGVRDFQCTAGRLNFDPVPNLLVKTKSLAKGMIIGVGTNLQDLIVHLEQAAINTLRRRRKRRTSAFQTHSQPSISKRKSPTMTKWTGMSISKPSMTMSLKLTGEKMST